jgi:hypothetical protein
MVRTVLRGVPRRVPRAIDSYHRPIPAHLTGYEHHALTTDTCPDCGGPLEERPDRVYYEEDIVLPGIDDNPGTTAVKHTAECAHCPRFKRLITAVPLPAVRVIIGPKARLFISTCAIRLYASHERTRSFLREMYGFRVSTGAVPEILVTEGTVLLPEHARIVKAIQAHYAAHYDETAWRTTTGGTGSYGWVRKAAAAPEEAYLLGESRGRGVAERLKGESTHIGITDHNGAYDTLFSHDQLCSAHPTASSATLCGRSSSTRRTTTVRNGQTTRSVRSTPTCGAVLETSFDETRYVEAGT